MFWGRVPSEPDLADRLLQNSLLKLKHSSFSVPRRIYCHCCDLFKHRSELWS